MELLAATLDLARSQHGWVRTSQVRALGCPGSTFADWCRAGLFLAGPRGFWRPVNVELTPLSALSLGVLACGPDAAVTGEAGLFLHGVVRTPPPTVRVVHPMASPGARHLGDVDVRVVPSRTLRVRDVTRVDGIRAAIPSRCLVDTCHRPWPTLEHVRSLTIDTVQRRKATIEGIEEQLDHCEHVKGTSLLRLATQQVSESGADSHLVHEVWSRLVADGFRPDSPPRVVPTPARTLHPDITLGDGRVCIECDGLLAHAEQRDLMIDHRKNRAYRAADHEVLRIGWFEFTHGWAEFVADLRDALRRVT